MIDSASDTPPRLSQHARERIHERLSSGEEPELYLMRQWPTRTRIRRTGSGRALYQCRNCELIVDERAQVVITAGPVRFWASHMRKARMAQEVRLQRRQDGQAEDGFREGVVEMEDGLDTLSDEDWQEWIEAPDEPSAAWEVLRQAAKHAKKEIEEMTAAQSLYTCLRCQEKKPDSAYAHHWQNGARLKFCKQCVGMMSREARERNGNAPGRPKGRAEQKDEQVAKPVAIQVVPTSAPAPVADYPQQEVESAMPSILDHLMQARVDIMNLRDWLDWDNDRTAILCGADLFIRAGKAGVWVLRPDGSDVPEPITPKVILALAGSREGLVFW